MKQILTLTFIFCLAVLTACASATTPSAPPTTESSSQIANPASENCIKQGGNLLIQKRGDGGEYGVCLFEDNRQCEEWALMRGDCPVGGRKVTGYATEAATYCVITGGEYAITGMSGANEEQGTCTLKNGTVCDVGAYFNGTCDANSAMEIYSDPFAYCAAAANIGAPDARYNGEKMPTAIVEFMVQKGIVTADAPAEIQQNAAWRCMDNNVWVCHFGANLPCLEKGDASKTVTSEMESYCAANPTADVIPANVTGRATVFEWKCKDGKPEAGKQVFNIDAQGFIANFWYELPAK